MRLLSCLLLMQVSLWPHRLAIAVVGLALLAILPRCPGLLRWVRAHRAASSRELSHLEMVLNIPAHRSRLASDLCYLWMLLHLATHYVILLLHSQAVLLARSCSVNVVSQLVSRRVLQYSTLVA